MVSRLCPNCALCCNGVLFADVRLQPSDNAARLAAVGVALKKRGAVLKFQQPCSCLEGNRCRIYADRPQMCRTFECRLLQRAQAGEINVEASLKVIRMAKRRAEVVREILRGLGDEDESTPLSRRYERMRNIITRAINGASTRCMILRIA